MADLKPSDPGYGRYSFKIKLDKFAEDQTIDGIETLNLNNEYLDPSMVREVLAYEIFRNAGVVAARTAYAQVYLNGAMYGLYVSVEEVERPFLSRHFADGGGNLYKPNYGDLVFRGGSISDYGGTLSAGVGKPSVLFAGEEAYEKQSNKDGADFADILSFIEILGNTPDESLMSGLGTVFDLDRFTSFLAANALIVALDFYGGGLPQNYLLYHDPDTDKFSYIPWDMNNAFGTFDCFLLTPDQVVQLPLQSTYCLNTPNAMNAGVAITPLDRPLIGRLLANPSIHASYRRKVGELLRSVYEPASLQARVDALAATIRPTLEQDPRRFYTMGEFDQSLTERTDQAPGIKTFINQRAQVLSQLLAEACADAGAECGSPFGPDANSDAEPTCATCETYHAPAARCVPTCVQGCTCPATSPDGKALICDEQQGLCHP